MIIEGFNYLEMQLLIGEEAAVKTQEFIEDAAVLASYRHLMNNLDTKSHCKSLTLSFLFCENAIYTIGPFDW